MAIAEALRVTASLASVDISSNAIVSTTKVKLAKGRMCPIGSEIKLTTGEVVTVMTEKDSSGCLQAVNLSGIKAITHAIGVSASLTSVRANIE